MVKYKDIKRNQAAAAVRRLTGLWECQYRVWTRRAVCPSQTEIDRRCGRYCWWNEDWESHSAPSECHSSYWWQSTNNNPQLTILGKG